MDHFHSLACKEIWTETSHCEQSCFWKNGLDHLKKTLMIHTTLSKMGMRCPLWSIANTKSDFFKTMPRINIDLQS